MYKFKNSKVKEIRTLGMPIPNHKEWLQLINHSRYTQSSIDFYNQGELVEQLESRVAKIVGKQSALFFNKGTIAQYSALKSAEEKKNNSNFIAHPLSHIAWDEDDAYRSLLKLNGILIGELNKPFSIKDITAVDTDVSAVIIELPLRRAGFKLTEWEELNKIHQWCKSHNVHLHMDGARLWESTSYYQKTMADIASLFDTVYVSLYKGIGALGGAILAGEPDFIESCQTWRNRFGGCAFTSFPLLISALEGLDTRYEKIPSLVQRAHSVAEQLAKFPQLDVNRPQSNGFFVFVKGDREKLKKKAEDITQSMGIKLFNDITFFPKTHNQMIEIQIGVNHHTISDEEIDTYFSQLLESFSH
ncbi:MAG: beta-eliminating lyase-related protein [Pseudomonadota bacterium]